MKLKVIGWVYYGDDTYPEGEVTWSAYNTILDEVKDKGYLFTGWHHQESFDCTPVLNDGKVRRFSSRGWGGLMGEAQGLKGRYSYSPYAFLSPFNEEVDWKIPTEFAEVDESKISTADNLADTYVINATANTLEKIEQTKEIFLPDVSKYRYIDSGDVVIVKTKGNSHAYRIVDIDKQKAISKRDADNYAKLLYHKFDKEKEEKIVQKYENAPYKIKLTVTKIKQ